jgi:hypothetical protein
MEMFRQIAPNGITNREIHVPVSGEDLASQLDGDEEVAHDHSPLGLGVETHTGPIIGSPTDARFAVHRKAVPSPGGATGSSEGPGEDETTQSAGCPAFRVNQ